MVIFKHGCSLETYLELKKNNSWLFIFFKQIFKLILICTWMLKSDYRLFYCSFGDMKFYYFLLTYHDTMVLCNSFIIKIVKDIYQFSQPIIRQKTKYYYNCKP